MSRPGRPRSLHRGQRGRTHQRIVKHIVVFRLCRGCLLVRRDCRDVRKLGLDQVGSRGGQSSAELAKRQAECRCRRRDAHRTIARPPRFTFTPVFALSTVRAACRRLLTEVATSKFDLAYSIIVGDLGLLQLCSRLFHFPVGQASVEYIPGSLEAKEPSLQRPGQIVGGWIAFLLQTDVRGNRRLIAGRLHCNVLYISKNRGPLRLEKRAVRTRGNQCGP